MRRDEDPPQFPHIGRLEHAVVSDGDIDNIVVYADGSGTISHLDVVIGEAYKPDKDIPEVVFPCRREEVCQDLAFIEPVMRKCNVHLQISEQIPRVATIDRSVTTGLFEDLVVLTPDGLPRTRRAFLCRHPPVNKEKEIRSKKNR